MTPDSILLELAIKAWELRAKHPKYFSQTKCPFCPEMDFIHLHNGPVLVCTRYGMQCPIYLVTGGIRCRNTWYSHVIQAYEERHGNRYMMYAAAMLGQLRAIKTIYERRKKEDGEKAN